MNWYSQGIPLILKQLKTNPSSGLKKEAAEKKLKDYGKNSIEEKKNTNIFIKIIAQLKDYMVIILLIAATLSFGISIIEGHMDFVEPIIIIFIVMLNAAMGVIQESKAEKALDSLKNLLPHSVTVRRDNIQSKISTELLVPGDIIILKAGDQVPADCRLLTSFNLSTDESSLTGESIPTSKNHTLILNESTPLGDRKNMIFSSTMITTGNCEAVVVSTGSNTIVGEIASLIISEETPRTPLQNRLAKTGETLGKFALIICGLIFLTGILRHIPPLEMFMTSVSLAVAAIPEGLPAIVTIMLAIGVQNMAEHNAIIRKLPAVETLGSASVICSDKTGTLTQNKMSVVEVKCFNNNLIVDEDPSHKAISIAMLCSNNSDATETAILRCGEHNKILISHLLNRYPKTYEIPFNSERKMMTTVHKSKNGYLVCSKGAPDVLIQKCQLTYKEKDELIKMNKEMAQKALRVIAVAFKEVDSINFYDVAKSQNKTIEENINNSVEDNLFFCGLIGIIDPPRPEVKSAISTCKSAGIKTVMITGDHLETAMAIGKSIGLYNPEKDLALTGLDLLNMTDTDLEKNISKITIFARVSPFDKVRIVKAFQNTGNVVAMTGDGVNDAPALKAADIGCSMGITGTDVAKDASSMVLTDDNFATIVSAVKYGRNIYSNIRKAVHFLLSSNIGEIITILVAMLLGWASPLIAIHLLWVNLVTDSFPALALGLEKADSNIMKNKPVDKNKGFFTNGLSGVILVEGLMIGSLALFAFSLGFHGYRDLDIGRTMAFAVLGLSQLFHAFNIRTESSIFSSNILSNKYLVGSFILCTLLQVSVISFPPLAILFKAIPLTITQWILVFILSFLPIIFVEIGKKFNA